MSKEEPTQKQEAKDVVAAEQKQEAGSSLKTVEQKAQILDDLRKRVIELKDLIDHSYWELAKNLHQIYDTRSYQAWGFSTFNEYVEKDLQFGSRKGRYLVSIYSWWHTQPQELQDRVKEIGWSKAKELVGIEGKEKVTPLLEKAETMGRRDFSDHVKKFKAEQDFGGPIEVELLQAVGFKLPAIERKNVEQAINIVQEMAQGSRSKALSLICLEFLAGYTVQEGKKPDVGDFLQNAEKNLGVKLVAIKDDEFVYGEETVNKILEKGEKDGSTNTEKGK